MDDKILVIGATGKQGHAVVAHLMERGHEVKAMTREPQKAENLKRKGVEIVEGDLLRPESLDAAFKGTKRMFLMTTPYDKGGVESEIPQGINAVDAARRAGVEFLVYSSVGSAQRQTGIPHFDSKRKVEEHIQELGFNYFFLRPAYFMDNFGTPWSLPYLKQGSLSLPVKSNRKLAMVAVDDIGRAIAEVFEKPDNFMGQEIEYAGDELTFPEALDKISKATGKKIAYNAIPEEGSDKIFGNDVAAMYKWFNDVGYNPDIPEIEKRFNFKMTNFDEYLTKVLWLNELKKSELEKQTKGR